MILPRVMVVAAALLLGGMATALAQFPPPPNPDASKFPPAPGPGGAVPQASPIPTPGQQPQGPNPCEAFVPIRAQAEKDATAIKAASDRKASREEVCPLFKRFAVSEAKMVKFLKDNQSKCGIPPEAIKQSGLNHNKTVQIRNQVCSTGPGPVVPRLSDAFGGPLVPSTDTTPNRGTFDTLTGNPLRP